MIAIDSMTVFTPVSSFIKLPEIFSKLLIVDSDTGEVLEDKPKPVVYEEQGIKIRCFLTNVFKQQYVSITVTTKMLKSDYITGINKFNFRDVFYFLKETFDFEIDYTLYVSSSICSDIDFKRDIYQTDKDFSNHMTSIKSAVSYAKIFRKKGKYLDENLVSGLQFVNRKDANISKPFVKFYDKTNELLENSTLFFETFLKDSKASIYELKRQEVTIKNVEHLRSVLQISDRDVKVNSLEYILNLDKKRILDIINNVTSRHFSDIVLRQPQQREDITKFVRPRDYFIVMLMRELMLKGYSMKELFLILNEYPAINPNTKSRIIKDIKSHFKRVLRYDELATLTVGVNDAFGLKATENDKKK